MKAKAQYKAALKLLSRLQGKADISQEEKSKLAWAEQRRRERKDDGDAQLIEALFSRMEEDPSAPMPTFDGAGWLNGVKILKCNDDPTRQWMVQKVPLLEALWEGAKLEVVDRELIPSIPQAKVLFPIAVQGERALKLLQRQNQDVPTADWKVLHAGSPLPNEGGQHVILQISKEAEDIVYPKFGKMAWGVVHLVRRAVAPAAALVLDIIAMFTSALELSEALRRHQEANSSNSSNMTRGHLYS
ncbi:GL18620 [Drosophila persimilis]|uniref:GL18620 n=1 Tax=Drosophila persimilis TaxID=7234 RepID=B4G9M6_DROPE|nr:GL18620 [Drosophila persimilis]